MATAYSRALRHIRRLSNQWRR